jgi:hypothetical protein
VVEAKPKYKADSPMSDTRTPSVHDVIISSLKRMKQAGESHEMAARWIMEDLRVAGFAIHAIVKDKPFDMSHQPGDGA